LTIRSRLRSIYPLLALVSFLLFPRLAPCWAQDEGGVASIFNEFIKARVTTGPSNAGRFAVGTTGGDPTRASDNDKVLIYGTQQPWTSYTTVSVDGTPWVFGGATQKRAGKSASYGTVTQQPAVVGNDKIVCAWRLGPLEVTQEIGFARSTTTRMLDTARISYTVANKDSAAHSVGLRIALDTMLGDNDGAPLRIGDRAITTATSLSGTALPDYWQAFDSLSSPSVTAQGTLRAQDVRPPDRMIAVDWGTAADQPWDFALPDRDFTRAGEDELDSAALLYWDPQPLGPAESRTYTTFYGLGGITLSPGRLSIGVTAPAEVNLPFGGEAQPFSVVAYIENSGGFEARDVAATIELPPGLALVNGPNPSPAITAMAPKATTSAAWMVKPTGEQAGPLKLVVAASSSNVEANRVEREIMVHAPPALEVRIEAPAQLGVENNRYTPNPFEVKAVVTNSGTLPAQAVAATIALPPGLELTEGEKPILAVQAIDAGGSNAFTWRVSATGLHVGQLSCRVTAESPVAKPASAEAAISVPLLTPEVRFFPENQTVPLIVGGKPAIIPIEVRLSPAREFFGARFTITYDPKVIEPLSTSRGVAFVEEGKLLSPWRSGVIDRGAGVISQVEGLRNDAPPLTVLNASLITVTFRAVAPGTSALVLKEVEVLAPDGQQMEFEQFDGAVTVAPAP